MPRFNIGDQVIALKNSDHPRTQPLVKGKRYTVEAAQFCDQDGHQFINVGFKLDPSKLDSHKIDCSCGKTHTLLRPGLFFTNSAFFVKADEIQTAIDVAVQAEDYETAALLVEVSQQPSNPNA